MPIKRRTIDIGKHYETTALKFLQARGLKLIERNYHSKAGEIDLIMRDKETYIFVEVRYRTQYGFANSAESITYQKQRKIRQTALAYLQHKKLLNKVDCRIDVIAIDRANKLQVAWIRDAI